MFLGFKNKKTIPFLGIFVAFMVSFDRMCFSYLTILSRKGSKNEKTLTGSEFLDAVLFAIFVTLLAVGSIYSEKNSTKQVVSEILEEKSVILRREDMKRNKMKASELNNGDYFVLAQNGSPLFCKINGQFLKLYFSACSYSTGDHVNGEQSQIDLDSKVMVVNIEEK